MDIQDDKTLENRWMIADVHERDGGLYSKLIRIGFFTIVWGKKKKIDVLSINQTDIVSLPVERDKVVVFFNRKLFYAKS